MSTAPVTAIRGGTPNLNAALIKAQQAMKPALKTAVNPHFKSRFVDLAGVNEACDEALWGNGLTVTQTTEVAGGATVLVTTLLHESGEERSGTYPLVPAKDRDPQAMGACLTYARRYAKMAILGLAPEDDDGETASGRPHPVKAAPRPTGGNPSPRREAVKPVPHDPDTGEVLEPEDNDDPGPSDEDAPQMGGENYDNSEPAPDARPSQIKDTQWKLIFACAKQLGLDTSDGALSQYVNSIGKADHRSEAWTWKNTNKVIDTMKHELGEHRQAKKSFCPLCR